LAGRIAQVIVGHTNINTTMGYNARRTLRPAEEYRTSSETEWEDFLGHFERAANSPPAPASAPTAPPASTTLASDGRSSDLTRPNGCGLPRSATT
jgi:hypothetical protein